MKKIEDEFAGLAVSRQRKRQLRWKRDGLCRICGKKAITGYCQKHDAEQYARVAKRQGTKKPTGRKLLDGKILPTKAERAYWLRFQGFSWKEVAERLSITTHSAYVGAAYWMKTRGVSLP